MTIFGERNADRQRRRRFIDSFRCPQARATRALARCMAAHGANALQANVHRNAAPSLPPPRPTRASRFDKTASGALSTRRTPDPAPTPIGLLSVQRGKRTDASAPLGRRPSLKPGAPHSTTPADALFLPPQSRLQQKAPEQPDARAQSADLRRELSNRPSAGNRGIKKAGSPPQRRRTRCVGSPSRARTCDTWINSPPLYRLSYQGIKLARFARNRPAPLLCARNRPARSLRPTAQIVWLPEQGSNLRHMD